MIKISHTPLRLLIADDDVDDVQLTKDCFTENQLPVLVDAVYNVDMLMEYLKAETKKLPQIILLDIKMPGKSGLDALKEIKKDENLRRIPVIVYSTSKAIQEIETSYELGASCFVSKPKSAEEWCDKINKIGKFWTECSRVPQ